MNKQEKKNAYETIIDTLVCFEDKCMTKEAIDKRENDENRKEKDSE